MTEVKITKRQGRACLTAMRKIADGAHSTKSIEHDRADDAGIPDALHALGWCIRDRGDYFVYKGQRDGLPEYRPEQVLMALALCVTLSGCRP